MQKQTDSNLKQNKSSLTLQTLKCRQKGYEKHMKKSVCIAAALCLTGTVCVAGEPLSGDDYYIKVLTINEKYPTEHTPELTFIAGEKEYFIGNEMYSSDTALTVSNERTYIPIRSLAEAFGAELIYDDGNIALTDGIMTAKFKTGETHLDILFSDERFENYSEEMNAAPFIDENNRCLVPLRSAAEDIFGCDVSWNEELNKVTIIRSYETKRIMVSSGDTELSFDKYNPAEYFCNKWGQYIVQFSVDTPDVLVKKYCEQIAADENVENVYPDSWAEIYY